MKIAMILSTISCFQLIAATVSFIFYPHKFIPKVHHHHDWVNTKVAFTKLSSSEEGSVGTNSNKLIESDDNDYRTTNPDEIQTYISSPLRFIGPYPALALHFPSLATQSQRTRNVTGISLDFVLDTAANTNTINAQVATELQLQEDGSALPGYNAAGYMEGGKRYKLGNCTLDLPEYKNLVFMTDLTSSALPVASPAAAGLLSVAFLNCFLGGVLFEWGGLYDGLDGIQPCRVTFYSEQESIVKDEIRNKKMVSVPIKVLKDILLPTVSLRINGVDIPALLDTGSPISILNSVAAKQANIKVVDIKSSNKDNNNSGGYFNPFKKISDGIQSAQSYAKAVTEGNVLVIAGGNGQTAELLRTQSSTTISLGEGKVNFPNLKVYVGHLPGLEALGGLNGDASAPAAILGMDVLRSRPMMLYRQNEVFF